jgi:phage baseplate assembly protein W
MAKSLFFGFNPPFLTDISVMPVQTDERLIKNDLLQLLLTTPGERVFRPDFGTDLKGSLFEPIDTFTINNIRQSIIRAISTSESRVKVSDVLIDNDDIQLRIKVFAALVNNPNKILELDLTIPIGPTIT